MRSKFVAEVCGLNVKEIVVIQIHKTFVELRLSLNLSNVSSWADPPHSLPSNHLSITSFRSVLVGLSTSIIPCCTGNWRWGNVLTWGESGDWGIIFARLSNCCWAKIVNEYDQEIPQSQTAFYPVAPRRRAAQPSRNTRKTN